jgi:AraC-like DNA-binding protein
MTHAASLDANRHLACPGIANWLLHQLKPSRGDRLHRSIGRLAFPIQFLRPIRVHGDPKAKQLHRSSVHPKWSTATVRPWFCRVASVLSDRSHCAGARGSGGRATSQKEIAESLGYKDVASFTRAFREAVGLAPGAYRKRFGGKGVSPVDFAVHD